MSFSCSQLTFRVSDIERSKEFYVTKLGLSLLDDRPNFFAVRAGDVRFSFFGGFTPASSGNEHEPGSTTGLNILLRTDNIEATRNELIAQGIELAEDIIEAPGFLKFLTLLDPDGNTIQFGEYLGDPLSVNG